jgi:DNA-binding NtrC family response regulator
VLDAGEYQRLGEARPRTSDFRFVAATNRGVESLKADLAARLTLAIHVPGLGERREDIPLLARHIVKRIAKADGEIAQRFLRGAHGEPCFSPELISALTRHEYSTHVRELQGLLWRSLQASPHAVLECTSEVKSLLRLPQAARAPQNVSSEELRAALARHGGVKEHAWRELGLSSRYALLRLMRKLGEA